MVEEDHRKKLPTNWEAKKSRLEWKLNDEEKRKVRALSKGISHKGGVLKFGGGRGRVWFSSRLLVFLR